MNRYPRWLLLLAALSLPGSLAARNRPVRILCAGDSITDGLAATDSYRAPLKRELAKAGLEVEFVGGRSGESNPASTLKHQGIPGLRVEQLAAQIDGWVDAFTPDIVLLMIGTNNIWMGYDVEPAQKDLRALIDGLTTRHPAVRFIVSNIPPVDWPEWGEHAKTFNAVFPILERELRRDNLSFVEVYSRFNVKQDLFATLGGKPDRIHPSLRGHAKIAQAWAKAISAWDAARTQVEQRAQALVRQMTLEEKVAMVGGVPPFFTRPLPRLKIPSLKMSDGPLGVHDYGPTTAYPAGIALAASWDTDLARRFGVMMGQDARARGVHIVLAPGMNIYRAPMCGRNFEYFGEDPYLASRMAVSEITGIQSQGVMATAKHFAANNQEYDRYDVSSNLDERTLREIYLPAFEASVKEAKVGAIMDSYNPVNGVHMTQNGRLNNEIAKGEWGFDGIMMSDWGSTHDGVAAANGGLDLEMPAGELMAPAVLLQAVKDGRIAAAVIDDKVLRILRQAIAFGFLDRGQSDPAIPLYNSAGRELALEAARSGMVLLKNDGGLLPLDKKKIKTVAVIGPDAYPAVIGGGGSSLVSPFHAVSYLEGISDYLGPDVKVLTAADTVPMAEMAAQTEFSTAPAGGSAGLKGEYFNNQDLQGAAALTRTEPRVDFDWGNGSYDPRGPADHFSARWTAYYTPKKTGDYRFHVSADDGVRLFVDNELLINDWTRRSETLNTATKSLKAGQPYKVVLEYFEEVGAAAAHLGIVPADQYVGRDTKPLAAKADAVIVCVGFNPSSEVEGADRTFRLPDGQDQLIREIAAVNKNIIVVLTAGGGVDMGGWIDQVPALLTAWYPGQEGGRALAQILFGEASPSGKLPASFEKRWEDSAAFASYSPQAGSKRVPYQEGVFLGYRHFDRSSTKPLFAFGHGLSYTSFQYGNLSVTPGSASDPEAVSVSFDLKNTGARAGAEVAQLYIGDAHSGVARPVKELKGFAKVMLQPGETRPVTLRLNRRALSYYDEKSRRWTAQPGEFAILVGGASDAIALKGSFTLTR